VIRVYYRQARRHCFLPHQHFTNGAPRNAPIHFSGPHLSPQRLHPSPTQWHGNAYRSSFTTRAVATPCAIMGRASRMELLETDAMKAKWPANTFSDKK